ncbi:MAG: methyl-accepting chemotaxis protein [Venatoribacter sp.]
MKSYSLKNKLFIAVLSVVIVMTAVMVGRGFQGINDLSQELASLSEKNLSTAVANRLKAETQAYSQHISSYVNSAFRLPLSLSGSLKESIENEEANLTRSQAHYLIGSLLKSNSDISALYAHFEANAFDGRDSFFVNMNQAHSTESQGSFEDYWIHNDSGQTENVKVEDPSEKYLNDKDEFGIRTAEWYLCPKETLKPCLLDPQPYEIRPGYSELMMSLVVPIIAQGEFRGVVGADINIPIFQTLVEKLSQSLYDGKAQVTLISQKGMVVASSHHKNSIRKPLSKAMPEQAATLQKLHQGSGLLVTDKEIFVSNPLHFPAASSEWALIIELPKSVAFAELTEQQQLTQKKKASVATSQIIVGLIIAAISLLIVGLLIRSIILPINTLNQQVAQLASAEGDLSRELKLDTHAELIALGHNFNLFMHKLRDMVHSLKEVSNQVRQESEENCNISRQTDQATEQQQNEIDNVVTATQEMSATAGEVARIASEVASSTQEINRNVTTSQQQLAQAVDTSLELSSSMNNARDSINKVVARSEDIGRILTVIGSIAEQTNLLALNAAIEAARAGEQGRGFAVVADEVRTLASRTQASTGEINTMINDLQNEVSQAVQIIEQGSNQAGQTMQTSRTAHESLYLVVEAIGQIVNNIHQVATAAEEQSSVSADITKNLTIIGDAAQKLSGLAQQAMAGSQHVNSELDKLDKQLGALRT